jgi:hypothetical protein
VVERKKLVVIGDDQKGLLALRMEFREIANRGKRWAPCEILVNGSQLATALGCLSDTAHVRIKILDNQLEVSDNNTATLVFNVVALEASADSATHFKRVDSVRISSQVIETLSRASVSFPTFVRISLSRKNLRIFEPSVARRILLSITLPESLSTEIEAMVPSIFLRKAWDVFRRTNPERLTMSTTMDGRIMLESNISKLTSIALITQKGYRGGLNLAAEHIPPEFRTTPIIQLIRFIGARAQGVDLLAISQVGLEMSNLSNLKQIQSLGLVTTKGPIVRLSDEGRNLFNLLRSSDQGPAKAFVHDLASKSLPSYRRILSLTGDSPIAFEELLSQAVEGSNNEPEEAKNTALIMLGLASWCGVLERKAGLFYTLAPRSRVHGDGESFKEARSEGLTAQKYS